MGEQPPSSAALQVAAPGKFLVGTSGFYYGDWIGTLYPPGSRPEEMLPLYAQEFPVVELNFTFYHLPHSRTFEQMVRRTPDRFEFIVKLHADVSHGLDLRAVGPFLERLAPLEREARLAGLLCQFPQRFHCDAAGLGFVKELARRLEGLSPFVEFRHISWAKRTVLDEVQELGLRVVSVDVPAMAALFPRRLISGRDIYVRFHSRDPANWYDEGKDRYDYLYSEGELSEWIELLAPLLGETERVYMFFNNCQRAKAAANALQVKRLIEQRFGPEALATAVPVGQRAVQGVLFPS